MLQCLIDSSILMAQSGHYFFFGMIYVPEDRIDLG